MSLLRPPDVSCQELVELLTDYLDGALPRRRQKAVAAHLMKCEDCTAYLDQLRTTVALTGRLRMDDVDPVAMDALVEHFRDWKGAN